MKKILLLVAVIAASFSLNAQRTVDISATVTNPSTTDTVKSAQTFDLEFTVTNNGPDVIKVGDTIAHFLIIGTQINLQSQIIVPVTAQIEKDSSINLSRTLTGGLTGGTSGMQTIGVAAVLVNRGGADTVKDNNLAGNNISRVTFNYINQTQSVDEFGAGPKLNSTVYPNPINSQGTISYTLPENLDVSIKLYDLSGREVLNIFEGSQGFGDQNVRFNTENIKNGIYFYTLKAGDIITTEKVIIRK